MSVDHSFSANTKIKSSEVNENFTDIVNGNAFSFKRQGGDTTDWNSQGTTNYDIENFKMQCGSLSIAASTASTITFPVAFAGNPIITATPFNSTDADNITDPVKIQAIDTTTVTIRNQDPGNTVVVHWIAIGPK